MCLVSTYFNTAADAAVDVAVAVAVDDATSTVAIAAFFFGCFPFIAFGYSLKTNEPVRDSFSILYIDWLLTVDDCILI